MVRVLGPLKQISFDFFWYFNEEFNGLGALTAQAEVNVLELKYMYVCARAEVHVCALYLYYSFTACMFYSSSTSTYSWYGESIFRKHSTCMFVWCSTCMYHDRSMLYKPSLMFWRSDILAIAWASDGVAAAQTSSWRYCRARPIHIRAQNVFYLLLIWW